MKATLGRTRHSPVVCSPRSLEVVVRRRTFSSFTGGLQSSFAAVQQNDLVHGWGMDMKLGYCAQGDRSKKIGIVDSEYIFHQGIQTLGGSGYPDKKKNSARSKVTRIRRQSTWELQTFKERWNRAVAEDNNWIDRSSSTRNRIGNNRRLKRSSSSSSVFPSLLQRKAQEKEITT